MSTSQEQEDAVIDDIRENRKASKKKRGKKGLIIEIVLYLLIIVFCIHTVPAHILQRTVVSGESMEDTLHNGESLLINKLVYNFHDPERYDIIVFYPKGRDVDEYYVKRIYGLPGETIYIKDNSIYVKGEGETEFQKLDDPYAKDAMDESEIELGTEENPYTLKSDEYYVLGDHRSVSLDSRFDPNGEHGDDAPGAVKRENIAGKVFVRIWPLSKFGKP
jgi:signal peptidase I